MTLPAPFFRALVVSATKFTRKEKPTTSSKQPGAVRGSFLSQHLSQKTRPSKNEGRGTPMFNCKTRATSQLPRIGLTKRRKRDSSLRSECQKSGALYQH